MAIDYTMPNLSCSRVFEKYQPRVVFEGKVQRGHQESSAEDGSAPESVRQGADALASYSTKQVSSLRVLKNALRNRKTTYICKDNLSGILQL